MEAAVLITFEPLRVGRLPNSVLNTGKVGTDA